MEETLIIRTRRDWPLLFLDAALDATRSFAQIDFPFSSSSPRVLLLLLLLSECVCFINESKENERI